MFTLRLLGSGSLDGPDGPVTGRAALRQRVALLALLAVEHPRSLSRDKLVACLWPESGTDDARHLLRESLYILRSALGDDSVLSSGDDLRLNPDCLSCDLWEFEAALTHDDLEQAVRLYHGPFLSGFHLSDAEEFERWADGERSRLARRYGQVLEQLAEQRMRSGDQVQAAEWWSQLAGEDPYNSRIALRYMQALEAAGDRAGALRYAKAHSDLLRADLDATPEREVVALAERLRLESRAATNEPAPSARAISIVSVPPDGDGRAPLPTPPVPETPRPRRRSWALPTVLVLAIVVAVGLLGGKLSHTRPSLLAPGRVAATAFENRTGRPDLDDLGAMAADWIIRGVMEMPLMEVTDLEGVYARGKDDSGRPTDPLTQARQDGAGIVIRGSYYLSGDSVLFQAAIMDVATGRFLRSFEPLGAPLDLATSALEVLRERIAAGLSALVTPLSPPGESGPVDPGFVPPPSLAAYREFLAALQEDDWDRYRRAARVDSTFVAPLIQLAVSAVWGGGDHCSIADSVGTVLDGRRDQLTAWNRITIDLLRAWCLGDREEVLRLLRKRYMAYPRSSFAQTTYAAVGLQASNQPRAALKILRLFDPEHPEGRIPRPEVRSWYWWRVAAARHAVGEYRGELDITDRWHDSAAGDWYVIRGRALGALGRQREVMELVESMARASADSVTDRQIRLAAELAAHGQSEAARTTAERVLARLELGPAAAWTHIRQLALANRLLGRRDAEREALERIARSDADSAAKLEAEARLAVLSADTARARRIDSTLAEESGRRLRQPALRANLILARAQVAAGFGRREQAVALLHEARSRGYFPLGSAHVFHADPLLAPLRGYPPFEALLQPDN